MPHPDAAFDAMLADLRVAGSVLLNERYAAPWAIDIPAEPALREALGLDGGVRALPFHLVRSGAFELRRRGAAVQRVAAGEVLICPGGGAHRMGAGRAVAPVALADALAGRGSSRTSSGGATTELICGIFRLSGGPLNALLAALPDVLMVRTAGPLAPPQLTHAVEMLALEVAAGSRDSFTAGRLIEIFFAEAVRAYRQDAGGTRIGWFKGLDDPKIGRALAHVHAAPGAAWTVEALAALVALSPSRFAARFRDTVGQSAMSYVASVRMNAACRMLRDTDAPLAGVADAVGYQDAAAFSRAFKSLVGDSPARWRTQQRGAGTAAVSMHV